MTKYILCVFLIIYFSSCSSEKKSSSSSEDLIIRSSAMEYKEDNLYILSEFSNELIAYNTTDKRVVWKKSIDNAPKRLHYAKQLQKIALTSPDAGKIYVFDEHGALENTNDYYQQPLAIIWIDTYKHWIITDVALNRVYVANEDLSVDYFLEVKGTPRAVVYDAKYDTLLVIPFLSDMFSILEHNGSRWKIQEDKLLNQKATFAQNVEIYKDEILIPHQRSNTDTTFLRFDDIVRPLVSRYTRETKALKIDATLALHTIDKTVSKPIDIRVDESTSRAWIVNANSNDVSIVNLDTNTLVKHLDTDKQPTSILLNNAQREAYIYSALSYSLETFDMDTFESKSTIVLSEKIVSDSVQLGMEVFFDATNPKSMKDSWLSCENCHPDAKGDNQIWQQGLGPRNTTSLEGIKYTGRLHWTGDRDEVQDFEHTFRDLMQGEGFVDNPPEPLGSSMRGLSPELDAMEDYLHSLKFPLPLKETFYDVNASLRGKNIFESSLTQCLDCHKGASFTDSNESVLHNVGSVSRSDDTLSGESFDTPSLRGIVFSPPYLHDSSAQTLLEVLREKNEQDLHGVTSHLSVDELNDLVMYLKSL